MALEIKEITINSISELLTNLTEHSEANDYTLYRGQQFDWNLHPKISRLTSRGKMDKIKCEKLMIDEFVFYSKPYLNDKSHSPIDILSIAQHHGMATRLLDWTKNPLAAIWFAVNEVPEEGNKYGVVWKLDTIQDDYIEDCNPFDIKEIKLFRPNLNIQRIINQNAIFSIHGYSEEFGIYLKLEEQPNYYSRLVKFIIPSDIFWKIRYDLDILGINKMSLFPDLDGVSKYVEWLHINYTDEIDKHRYK